MTKQKFLHTYATASHCHCGIGLSLAKTSDVAPMEIGLNGNNSMLPNHSVASGATSDVRLHLLHYSDFAD